jgi:hypothetical protein
MNQDVFEERKNKSPIIWSCQKYETCGGAFIIHLFYKNQCVFDERKNKSPQKLNYSNTINYVLFVIN